MSTEWPGDPVICLPPEDIEGVVTFGHDLPSNYSLYEVIVHQCEYTHNFIRGNLTRVCGEDGMWTGDPPVCRRNDTKAYYVGSAIAFVCVVILVFMVLDFLRYQRKKARVREISQRRNKNESHIRPTSFFVGKLTVPYYTPFDNPPVVPDPLPESKDPESGSAAEPSAPEPAAIVPNNRVILPPLKSQSSHSVDETQSDSKKKKKKFIPKRLSKPDLHNTTSPEQEAEAKKKKSKLPKKHKIDPIADQISLSEQAFFPAHQTKDPVIARGGEQVNATVHLPEVEKVTPVPWARQNSGLDNQSYQSSTENLRRAISPLSPSANVSQSSLQNELPHRRQHPYYYTSTNT